MPGPDSDRLSSVYYPLRACYGLVPLLAGADKFLNLLTDWTKYVPEEIARLLPVSPSQLMMIVGVIEIVAGLAVLGALPRLGAYVVMIWLTLIAVTLVVAGYYDIAVRDLVMAVGAFALGQVAGLRGERWLPVLVSSQGSSTHVAAH